MSDLDPELVERVIRWCAEAGRQTGAAEIRAALSHLGWDEILNVRALLADPPPARPLGPGALADLARGAPADVAAEREREGRYRPEIDDQQAEAPASGAAPAAPPRAGRPRKGPRRPAAPLIHRKRDQVAPSPPAPPSKPALERLLDPAGRAVLERLIRDHGARRAFLLAELARWRRADGASPNDADLDALLDHHGLARAFAHRERDELLHTLRAARGDGRAAAAKAGLEPEAFWAALERLDARQDAEKIRADRRADLRGRATLADRCRQLATEADRLEDLGLLSEIEADVRARLGEHLRALRAASPGSLTGAFARSVSLEERDAVALAARLGIALSPPAGAAARPSPSRPPFAERRPAPRTGAGTRDRPFRGRPERSGERGAGGRAAGRGPGRGGPDRRGRDAGRGDGPPRADRSAGRGAGPRGGGRGPARGSGPRKVERGTRGGGKPSGSAGPRRPGGRGPRPAR